MASVLGYFGQPDFYDLRRRQAAETLGTAFVISLLIAIASANSGIAALFDALNVAYNERDKRSFVNFHTTTLVFTLAGMGFVVTAIIGVVAKPLLMKESAE